MSSRPSPLPNRVAPDGSISANPARGGMMGNRGGRIHEGFAIKRRFASKAWIACVLNFKDRHRDVMADGYTELFFLDEATALAAGHRPCYECRHARAVEFAGIWAEAHNLDAAPKAAEIDEILHRERLDGPWKTPGDALPTGAFYRYLDFHWLVFGHEALIWDHSGYIGRQPVPEGQVVDVMTTPSLCKVFAAGYRPEMHPSALEALVG
jgi:hypothetical protein